MINKQIRADRIRKIAVKKGILTEKNLATESTLTLKLNGYEDSISCGQIELCTSLDEQKRSEYQLKNEAAREAIYRVIVNRNFDILNNWVSATLLN
ncbi:hypothetical protein [Vibrio owensii]|uniref:hypothetical protein n=1 Tax=Vibrio owensii TaxID=696485 RepID=UPI003CC5793F